MPERGGATPPELVLAEGMSFAGLLVLPNDARIDGRIAGEVLASGSVEVGATGVVEADLEVSDVVVHGRVTGGIRARRSISLEPGAVVEGDIRAPHLSMAEGAHVDGLCHCGGPAENDAISGEHAAPRLDPAPSAS